MQRHSPTLDGKLKEEQVIFQNHNKSSDGKFSNSLGFKFGSINIWTLVGYVELRRIICYVLENVHTLLFMWGL